MLIDGIFLTIGRVGSIIYALPLKNLIALGIFILGVSSLVMGISFLIGVNEPYYYEKYEK